MKRMQWLLPGCVALLVAAQAGAAPPAGRDQGLPGFATAVQDLNGRFDLNSIDSFVTNVGSYAFDQGLGDAGMEWPKGTGRHVIFAAGLWVGATVNGEVRVTVGEFSQEFAAGPLKNDGSGDPVDPGETDPRYRVLKLNGADGPESEDYQLWQELAAELGEDGPPLDSEGNPELTGDQTLWCVYNDGVPGKHSNDAGNSAPLGIEVRQKVFGFLREGPLFNTMFIEFEIENKGSNVLENTYLSMWFDPDLGGFSDDLVGCDVDLSLGYCYNATNNDAQYGAAVPAVGCDFFLGPVVPSGDSTLTLGMTSFNRYVSGTDPGTAQESYNFMQGLQADGSAQTCEGEVTTFVLSGDPVTGEGCLDSNAADRRFMMSTGPFTMNPGEEQRIVGAVIVGGEQGVGDRLSNIDLLRHYDLSAQDAFDRDFIVPAPPPLPNLTAVELDGEVILTWGSESKDDYEEAGYEFQGYNIYQGASASGPFTRLATFDENDGIAKIKDSVFNPNAGALEEIIVQQGADTGIDYEFTVTEDRIRGLPLRNGTPYYFAVTAYSYGEEAIPGQKALENAIQAIEVIPQKMVSGVDLAEAAVGDMEYRQVDSGLPPATNVPVARIVNPRAITGHDYKIEFVPLDEPIGAQTHGWRVIDLTSPDTSAVYTNITEEPLAPFHGMAFTMQGVDAPKVQDAFYRNLVEDNPRAMSWVDWGGSFFNGAADDGCHWAGSTIVPDEAGLAGCPDATVAPERFGTVELRFTDAADGQKGYRYLRKQLGPDNGGGPSVGRGYDYVGLSGTIFEAWKVVGDTETQLTVMYTERAYAADDGTLSPEQPESQDGVWNPTTEGDGGREYLMILDVPYSETEDPTLALDDIFFGGELPVLYGAWFRHRGENVLDAGDQFVFQWGNPATENDEYFFSTTPATGIVDGVVQGSSSLAASRGDLKSIRVVPNPYLTRSTYEPDQFNRVMKFTNLPATCSVRVFSLAGDLVRTLEKDDATTSLLEWDMENDFGLPVGSGIYVFHVDAPGIGTTFGKLAVIMEEERLEDF